MTFRLPRALLDLDDEAALSALTRYYRPGPNESGFYTGSLFDTWDSTGSRDADVGRFTADDLVAVTFLSVHVDPRAAHQLLVARAKEFADLLDRVDSDCHLVECPDLADGWRLYQELCALPGTGPTTASKLLARKRPRLRPIYDTVVARVTGTTDRQWEPLRAALRADDHRLHHRLVALREKAGLSALVSPLRVFDVIAWIEGTAGT